MVPRFVSELSSPQPGGCLSITIHQRAAAMQLAEAAQDETAFSMRVLRHLASCDGSRANLAVSPLSLHAALALLAAGARGSTLDEIASFLGPAGGGAHAALASYVALRVFAGGGGGEGGGGTTVRFANGVWVDADLRLKASFARVAAEHYRAEARQAFFKTMPEEARRQINEWVASATAGRIKDLLPTGCLHRGTPAVLANALYFKGAWERKFDACLTRDEAFFLHDGRVVRAPFMSSTSKQCVACRHGYKVLRLRYAQQGGGGAHRLFSMYIYLPDAHDGLPALLHKLSADPAALLESPRTLADEVPVRAFRVPRFTVAYRTNARETLRDLGLLLPFDRAAADFGDVVEAGAPEPLVVSDAYHESFVEVNEEGTEAASATAVVMGFGCARMEAPVDFVADHPFVFLIKEELSGVVVFAGHVIDPSI